MGVITISYKKCLVGVTTKSYKQICLMGVFTKSYKQICLVGVFTKSYKQISWLATTCPHA